LTLEKIKKQKNATKQSNTFALDVSERKHTFFALTCSCKLHDSALCFPRNIFFRCNFCDAKLATSIADHDPRVCDIYQSQCLLYNTRLSLAL